MTKQVNFVFNDENTGKRHIIYGLNCTEDEFFKWLGTTNYDMIEEKHGIHDYSGCEEDEFIEVGFTSYEISEEDFPIVMEYWRTELLDGNLILNTNTVQTT